MGNRVLVFITDMASGGRQTVCRTLVNEWASNDRCCSLYVSYGGGINLESLDKRICVYVADSPVSRSLSKIRDFVNQYPSTPCLSLSTEITIALCLLKRFGLIRNSIYHRESMDAGSFSLKWRLIIKLFFPALSGLVCTSQSAVDSFKNIYNINHPATVISNPCRFADIPQEAKLNRHLLLSVGRLDPVKGHDRLLRAFAKYRDGYDLHIWGEGDERKKIEHNVDRLGLSGKVTLCGEAKDIRQVYSSGGIVVMSSYHEGLPNAMIEAILCGCRVVVPECLTGAVELLHELGLGDCVVCGEYEENLFATIAKVASMNSCMFDEARSKLAKETNPSFVCSRIVDFLKG